MRAPPTTKGRGQAMQANRRDHEIVEEVVDLPTERRARRPIALEFSDLSAGDQQSLLRQFPPIRSLPPTPCGLGLLRLGSPLRVQRDQSLCEFQAAEPSDLQPVRKSVKACPAHWLGRHVLVYKKQICHRFLKTGRSGTGPTLGRPRVMSGLTLGEQHIRNGMVACSLASSLS